MKKSILFTIIVFTNCFAATTAVLIPCHWVHGKHVPVLIKIITKQTKLPDEVIVSLSEYHKFSKDVVKKIAETEALDLPFKLVIKKTKARLFPIQNTLNAFKSSTADLIINQDADDTPHPQRIEIIHELYNKYKFDHLMHQWYGDFNSTFTQEEINQLSNKRYDISELKPKVSFHKHYKESEKLYRHDGNTAGSRAAFAYGLKQIHHLKIKKPGGPGRFNQLIYAHFKNKLFISIPLIQYNNSKSAWAALKRGATHKSH